MKSEPGDYSIDDLRRDKNTHWDGVRNYQARNFMKNDMRVGDRVLFYHSNANPSGVAGIAEVAKEAYPDHTAWDESDPHFDPKSDKTNPRWFMVDVAFVEKFPTFVSLEAIKNENALGDMMVVKRGMRLSIQPVSKKHFDKIVTMGERN